MFNKIKLYIARRQLAQAVCNEAKMYESAMHARRVTIPGLEEALERAELAVLTDEFYRDMGWQ